MTPVQDPGPGHDIPSDWAGLQTRLARIYEGYPLRRRQLLALDQTLSVALWKILEGGAETMEGDLHCRAGAGEWMVCLPGKRLQQFQESTRILAIHLEVECFGHPSGWRGPHLVAPGRAPQLSLAANQLSRAARKWNLCRDSYVLDEKMLLPLPGILEMQQHVAFLLRRLLEQLSRYGTYYEPLAGKDARVQEGLRQLIGQPLRQRFSRKSLARICSLSPSHLDRLWRQEVGMTSYQYWEQRRLKFACRALRNPRLSAKEVAFELGFDQPSQFSTWFRSHQGVSPSQFRTVPETI